MTEKKSFWSTLPGVITGIAAILTALVALVPVFIGNNGSAPDPEPSPTGSPSPTTSGPTTTATGGGGSAPVAVVAPRTLDFGRLGASRTAEQSVTVANTGSEYLVIEDVSVSGRTEIFSADPGDCLEPTGIAPGSDCEITVTFRPGAPGSYAGSLDIEHSAAGSPAQVALNGEGVLLDL